MARRNVGIIAVLGLVAVGLALFWRRPAGRPADIRQAISRLQQRDDTNVVFILIDTLRADHLSSYGYERLTSPVMDAIAQTGIRFARVRSQCSWTKPSMASLWTATYPARTGVLRYQHGLPTPVTMPAEILHAAGFRTAGIWRNGWIANNFGFGQGFDAYFRPVPNRPPARGADGDRAAQPRPVSTDRDMTESAREFLRRFGDQRFFLYLHYMDVHQYAYDEESARFGPSYEDAYDNAIHWVDRNIGSLLVQLDELGLLDRTLVVIASDHGEAFREHGGEGHGRNLYREVTEVPLIFRLPAPLAAGVVVEPLVENVDIWPTILDLLGLPPLEGVDGRSLVPLMLGTGGATTDDENQDPVFSHMDRTWGRQQDTARPMVSVTDGRYRLIYPLTPPGTKELYDTERDPGEQTNIAGDEPAIVERLTAAVDAYLARPAASWGGAEEVEIDAMRLDQLRALGYLAGRADEDGEPHVP
jgi:choline-sulfatase